MHSWSGYFIGNPELPNLIYPHLKRVFGHFRHFPSPCDKAIITSYQAAGLPVHRAPCLSDEWGECHAAWVSWEWGSSLVDMVLLRSTYVHRVGASPCLCSLQKIWEQTAFGFKPQDKRFSGKQTSRKCGSKLQTISDSHLRMTSVYAVTSSPGNSGCCPFRHK